MLRANARLGLAARAFAAVHVERQAENEAAHRLCLDDGLQRLLVAAKELAARGRV